YILEAHQSRGTLPDNAAVLISIVSSEFPSAFAELYGATMFYVLTGFNFFAELFQHFEEDHSLSFLFGFEVCYGYLVYPFVRDKDAFQALLFLAVVAAFYKYLGITLYDGLVTIFVSYVYYA
ncbi:phospho-sugar mutase, partial [Enterococcus lactis]|nr:phospho-sugar mutase [Enterococcus lactis]